MYSGSIQSQLKRPDVSIRRARSNVEHTIEEDRIIDSFTNIESDSAFGSADDDEVI